MAPKYDNQPDSFGHKKNTSRINREVKIRNLVRKGYRLNPTQASSVYKKYAKRYDKGKK